MIFPIGDDNVKGGAYPIVSYSFIGLNVLIFIYTISQGLGNVVAEYGANPCNIVNGTEYLDIITSMFLHGGIMHLIGNMLFLWIFADNVESTIGSLPFLIFYLLGGVVATLTHLAISGSSGCIPLVGASGAIAAVMGAYLVMFPQSRIKMLFIIKIFYIPAFIFLGFWIGQQLLSGFTSLRMFNDPEEGGSIAFWAHIGGFFFGLAAGYFFKTRYPKIEVGMNENRPEYHTMKMPAKRYNNRWG